MSDFAVVIGFQFDNEEYRSVILDTVDDVKVNGNSRITEQPMVNGDLISDHMYDEPKTMSMSGIISMNGSKVTVIDGQGSKLANFQELFERIQKEGIRCDIVKISINNEDDVRFLHRRNMVLQSHNWVEKINCLDYSLSFKEILTAETIAYDVDTDDEFTPNITEPATLSFTDTLINWDEILNSLVNILKSNDLVDQMTLRYWGSLGLDTLKSLVPAAVAVTIAFVIGAGGPATWIAGAVIAAIASAYIFIKGLVNFFKRLSDKQKFLIERFVWSKVDKKNKNNLSRFGDLVEKIKTEFEKANSLFHVYQFSSNEPQECLLSIGDTYYIFTFTQNNLDKKYSLKVNDINSQVVASKTDIVGSPTNFDQLNNSNSLFKATNNSSVYLLYNPIVDNSDETQKTATPDPLNLKNYCVLVCDMNIEKFQDLVDDIIKSCILKKYKSKY